MTIPLTTLFQFYNIITMLKKKSMTSEVQEEIFLNVVLVFAVEVTVVKFPSVDFGCIYYSNYLLFQIWV